ncbi:unnamed protein product [marine sediment metagenome]|uniref:Uncharacterized protein n=1 Tax=marine sediment metagenome TaxID=412755 RepID=X0VGU3_9ZZZZ
MGGEGPHHRWSVMRPVLSGDAPPAEQAREKENESLNNEKCSMFRTDTTEPACDSTEPVPAIRSKEVMIHLIL